VEGGEGLQFSLSNQITLIHLISSSFIILVVVKQVTLICISNPEGLEGQTRAKHVPPGCLPRLLSLSQLAHNHHSRKFLPSNMTGQAKSRYTDVLVGEH